MTIRTASIRELRSKLSEAYLGEGPIVVTSHGLPVATITPTIAGPDMTGARDVVDVAPRGQEVPKPVRPQTELGRIFDPEPEEDRWQSPTGVPARGLSKKDQASGKSRC